MKLRQKIYDSSESINRLIKITNSFHHYNNLKKIRERKPLYNINNYNNMRNKQVSRSNLGINNNYIYKSKENDIIINSIDKMKYNGYFNENKKFGMKKENKKYKKNNNTYENNKNGDYLNHKNNRGKKLFLPPIKKFNKQ
jgi:hypothetical protein